MCAERCHSGRARYDLFHLPIGARGQSPAGMAEYLIATVGPRITAAALGLASARRVEVWRDEGTGPREHDVAGRLSVLYRVAYVVVEVHGASTAALFLRSSNPQLDDVAPLVLLRERDPDQVQGRLLAATRAFVEG